MCLPVRCAAAAQRCPSHSTRCCGRRSAHGAAALAAPVPVSVGSVGTAEGPVIVMHPRFRFPLFKALLSAHEDGFKHITYIEKERQRREACRLQKRLGARPTHPHAASRLDPLYLTPSPSPLTASCPGFKAWMHKRLPCRLCFFTSPSDLLSSARARRHSPPPALLGSPERPTHHRSVRRPVLPPG